MDLLVLLARWLPPGDAQATIPRLLFSQDPFLDFGASGPDARAEVLEGAFQLLEVGGASCWGCSCLAAVEWLQYWGWQQLLNGSSHACCGAGSCPAAAGEQAGVAASMPFSAAHDEPCGC